MAQVKIGPVNSSEFRKSMIELGNMTKKTLGKSQVSLFDAETRKLLGGEADRQLGKLDARMGRLKTLMAGYAQKVRDSSDDAKKELAYKDKLIKTTQKLVELEKGREGLNEAKKGLKAPGGVFSGLKQGALENVPGLGKLSGLLSGGSALGLGVAGAVGAAGYYGYSRMSAGYDRFADSTASRTALMGRGVRDVGIDPALSGRYAKLGLNAEDMRKSRLASMDAFGSKGSTQSAVLGRAEFARNYGIDSGVLTSAGAGMRAQTGTKSANRDIMKLEASLQASEIKDAIGPYLETAAAMLTDIREQGMVQSGEVLSTLASLVKQTGSSPERIAAQMSGMQHAIQGSSGDANAFVQSAFSRKGIGGGTVGGAQAAVSAGGLYGVSLDDMPGLSDKQKASLQRMKIGKNDSFHARSGAILDQLKDQFGANPTGTNMLAEGRFTQQLTGASNPLESENRIGLLRKAHDSSDPKAMAEAEKMLKNAQSSPEERSLRNLEDINKSQENAVDELKAIRANQEEQMGKQSAGLANSYNGAKNSVDAGISGTVGRMTNALFGRPDTVGDLQDKKSRVQGELSAAKEAQKYNYEPSYITGPKVEKLQAELEKLNAQIAKQTDVTQEHADTAKEALEEQRKVTRNQTKPKASTNLTSGKTR